MSYHKGLAYLIIFGGIIIISLGQWFGYFLLFIGAVIGIILWVRHFNKLNERNLDSNGYHRDGYNRLVHRDVAFNHHYKEGYQNGKYTKRFREYDIHHKDRNKLNNHPDNLQILTREEHKKIHGIR